MSRTYRANSAHRPYRPETQEAHWLALENHTLRWLLAEAKHRLPKPQPGDPTPDWRRS